MRASAIQARLLAATALSLIVSTPAFAQDYGLQSTDSTPISNPSGTTLQGAKDGILSSGSSFNLDNAGTVRGDGIFNSNVFNSNGGVVISGGPASITNSGSISGNRFGIATNYFTFDAGTQIGDGRAIGSSLNNSGSIIGDNDDGVHFLGGGSVTNSGLISARLGAGADGIQMFAYNQQDRTGSSSIGSVTNLAGGTIDANRWGVLLSGGGSVNNAGTITGLATSSAGSVLIQGGLTFSALELGTLDNSGTLNGNVRLLALGDSTVTNSGTITGGGAGSALLTDSSMALTNTATGSITGFASGVFSSGAALSIDNAGTIRGNGNSALFNSPQGGVLITGGPATVTNSGSISGTRFGISTFGFQIGSGTNVFEGRAIGTNVTNSGSIIGDNDDGVRLLGGGTVTNSGYIAGRLGAGADGVSMFNHADQDLTGVTRIGTVNNLLGGTIEGARLGVILSTGGTVNNAGTINGGNSGAIVIQALDAGRLGTVNNSGTISGTVQFNQLDTANVDNSGIISSSFDKGITTTSPGGALVILNRATGSITGATQGIYSEGTSLSVDNAGTIRGNGTSTSFRTPGGGVVITGGPAAITNSGTISGARFGITTANFTDPVTSVASGRAIGTSVTNSGSIIGDNDDGVRLIGGGSVTNSGYIAGRVTAGADGISIFSLFDQDLTSFANIGSVTNTSTGTVEGARFGIILSNGGSVSNAGTITGASGSAILIQAQAVGPEPARSGTVGNSGTVNGSTTFNGLTSASLTNSGTMSDFVAFTDVTAASLTNSGSITAAVNDAVRSNTNTTLSVTNNLGGTITGAATGMYHHGPALTVTNAGLIRGLSDTGVAADGGPITITNSGTISGPNWGIVDFSGASGSQIANSGSISGSVSAISLAGNGQITNSGALSSTYDTVLGYGPASTVGNSGSIVSTSGSGLRMAGSVSNSGTITGSAAASSGDNAGVVMLSGSVSNAAGGIIEGGTWGVYFEQGQGSLNNAGIIRSLNRNSAVGFNSWGASQPATVVNSGTILGSVQFGNNAGAATLTNSGSITAQGASFAVWSLAPTTIVNSGSISTTGSTAISLLGNNTADTITLLTGSSITGVADGGTGNDTLRLSGSIPTATSSQSVGRFVNFENLNLLGGYWTAASNTGTFSSSTLNGGTFALNGSITSPFTVNAGATLAGIGAITGNVALNAGSILAPGSNGIGALTVTGNVVLNAGSTFSVQVKPDGTSDRLVVNGAFTINNGATLQVLAGIATYPAAGLSYTILTATGGIIGKFDKPVTDYAYYNASVNIQKKGTITLNLTPNGKPLPSAATPATFSTASAVDSLGTTSPLYLHVLSQSLLGARQAFSALSGSSYARLDAVMDRDVGSIRLDFDGSDSDAPLLSWTGTNSLAARGFNSAARRSRGPVSLFTAGGRYASRLSGGGITGDIDTRFLASAAAYRSGRFQALASVSSAWHEVSVARTIAFPGFAEQTQSHYRSATRRLELEGAYDLAPGPIKVAPYAGYAHIMISSPGFSETGGLSALAFGRENRAMDRLNLGIRAAGKFTLGGVRMAPHLDAGLERLWGAGDIARTAHFSNGGDSFDSGAYGFNRRAASLDAGLDLAVGPVALSASYRARLGDQWSDRTAKLTAGLRF